MDIARQSLGLKEQMWSPCGLRGWNWDQGVGLGGDGMTYHELPILGSMQAHLDQGSEALW